MYKYIVKAFSLRGLLANSFSFGTILTLAEATQESVEKLRGERAKSNSNALARHAFLGSCVIGPMLYTYYCWLDTRFPGKKMRTVAKKVANDIFIANIAYYTSYYYGMSYLEHKDHKRATDDVKSAFRFTYVAGMVYWGPVMVFNFAFISPTWRVTFIALMSFVETNGLCLIRRQKCVSPPPPWVQSFGGQAYLDRLWSLVL